MKILIVAKQSKYEYEKEKFSLTDAEIRAKYRGEHANLDAILSSHEKQLETRKTAAAVFKNADLLLMCQLREEIIGYDAVISLGGDNSFTYTSHFVGSIPLIGMNSDPARSVGALCKWTANDAGKLQEQLTKGDYKITEWARLSADIDGKKLSLATSEYFFGEKLRRDMSRHVVVYHGKEYEQKSSGIVIATGAGSTGWYDSSNRYYFANGNSFAKTEKKAAFVITEPYNFKAKADDLFVGELLPDEELVLHSLNDGCGYATADCWEEYEFSRGKKATVTISKQPLRTI
ncbi:NAD(+)/NADH kinase [Candidatus Woesearchaeota archaeon]|nr:NAD(+)/NADH kinase [Candidatus Woesearchaeota archaeon]